MTLAETKAEKLKNKLQSLQQKIEDLEPNVRMATREASEDYRPMQEIRPIKMR